MAAVKANDVDRALKSRRPEVWIVLFYGPDAGRVAERARATASDAVDDPSDAFQLVRLDGDSIADQPGRLAEEATTFGLFGGRRAIWVRPTSRSIAAAVEACATLSPADTLLVIEAGDLQRSSPLRAACEKAAVALACPCYGDEARDLGAIVTETLRADGLAIEPDARDLLLQHLGGDRLASRGELAKLALYAHGRDTVTVADIEAVVSDVSSPATDAVLDAAFLGRIDAVEAALVRLSAQGTAPASVLALGLRHALALYGGRDAVEGGQDERSVVQAWRGLNFRRQDAARSQLSRWSTTRLRSAVEALQAATLETRRSPNLGSAVTAAALFRIAGLARRSG